MVLFNSFTVANDYNFGPQCSLFVTGSKPGRHSARNLLEFGVARSGELEDNQ